MRFVPCLVLLGALSFTPAWAQPQGAPAKRPLVARIVNSIRAAATTLRYLPYLPARLHAARHPSGIEVSFIPGTDAADAAAVLQRLARAERSSYVGVSWNKRRIEVAPADSVQSIADRLAGVKIRLHRPPIMVRGLELRVSGGDHLSAAARVMARTARREGIVVDGTFNRKPIVAAPGASWKSIADQYRAQIR